MITHSDALAQLPQAMFVQAVAQFRLAHENNLQELPIVRFQIREQPDLLQQFQSQVLRLVNDQNGVLSLVYQLQKKSVQRGDRFQPVQAFDIEPKLHRDRLHEQIRIERRVQNQRRLKLTAQLLQQ